MNGSFHELFDVANKVDDLIDVDDNGFFIIDKDGNRTTDKETIQEFLTGVQTLANIVQEM